MECPICDVDLKIAERQGIEIDYCPKCRGVWLDRGELDKIIERSAKLEQEYEIRRASSHHHPPYDDHHNGSYATKRKNDDRYRTEDRRYTSSRHDDDRHYDDRYKKRSYKRRRKSVLEDIFDIFD